MGNIDKLPNQNQEDVPQERTVKGKRPIVGGRPTSEDDAELAVLDKIKLALLIVIGVPCVCYLGTTLMYLEHQGSFFQRRDHAVSEMSKTSPQNKVIAEAYAACLKPKAYDQIGATCALEAVSVARGQGLSEVQVADALAQLGIFETGCDPEWQIPRDVVGTTEELSALRATWCGQAAKKLPE